MLMNIRQPTIKLAEKAKMVASTCVGEIFATNTNGGMTKNARISGNRVEDVKKMKTNGLIPKVSYTFNVKAISNKQAVIMPKIASLNSVLVSHSFNHVP